jgi:methionine-S-sulfoxide reductase
LHDPTTLNQQGPDRGTQYRSLLGYYDESQKSVAETTTEKLNKEKFDDKITTTIEEVKNYCPAEEYHQKYIKKKYSFLNI